MLLRKLHSAEKKKEVMNPLYNEDNTELLFYHNSVIRDLKAK